jgi:polar amino acid transport system substrate-binding protein
MKKLNTLHLKSEGIKDQGVLSEMMRKSVCFFVSIILICILLAVNVLASDQNATSGQTLGELKPDGQMAFFLIQQQADIQGSLNDMDTAVADASGQLSVVGLEGTNARKILQNLTNSSHHIAEAVTISPEGKIVAAEPAIYYGSEGADISKQEATVRFLKTKNPLLSPVFPLVEGFNAFIVLYPVFSPSGAFMGGISVSIKPGDFLGAIISPKLKGTNYSAWLIQKDGLVLYDPDPSQVGKMLFDDPIYKPYPQLLNLGRTMVEERSGIGAYVFLTKAHDKNVTKEVYWTTVGLHSTEWQLAVTQIAP